MKIVLLCCCIVMVMGCANKQVPYCQQRNAVEVDPLLLSDLSTLASAKFSGRKPGTRGSQLAQQWLVQRYKTIGLSPFNQSYYSNFMINKLFGDYQATNIIGYIRGSEFAERYIVVSAHYDHLGTKGSRVYHGADDNASGVAAMLALARKLKRNPPTYSVIFLASDAEETGLLGAKHFVSHPPVPVQQIVFNLNLDMLARAKKLNLVGSSPYLHGIFAKALGLSKVCLTAQRKLRLQGSSLTIDYRRASDHWAFSTKGIAYLYLGGSPHPDYHLPSDVASKISPDHFTKVSQAVNSIYRLIETQLLE